MSADEEMLAFTQADEIELVRMQLEQLVQRGLLRMVKPGHYALTQAVCRACGAELHENAPRQRNGPLGYCHACRSRQLRLGWVRRRQST